MLRVLFFFCFLIELNTVFITKTGRKTEDSALLNQRELKVEEVQYLGQLTGTATCFGSVENRFYLKNVRFL